MWLQTQRNGGSIRSPVSNAYMEGNVMGLVVNKTVADIARHFRENLGRELGLFVEAIHGLGLGLGDGGFRIRNLVEMGADLNVKGQGGDTTFMTLIRKGQLEMVQFFLSHDVSVTIVNDDGLSSIDLIQREIREGNSRGWNNILKDVERKAQIEIEKKQQQEEARNENNAELRERQRVLADEARNITAMNRNGTVIDGTLIQNGLGSLEEGYGYFPSLLALQFQGSIPPPSASFAELEERERKRLEYIVKWISGIVFVIWILG